VHRSRQPIGFSSIIIHRKSMDCKFTRRLLYLFLGHILFNKFSFNRPLENDISTWNYELVAMDREGANVTDSLDVHVQQHKLSRSVNHEFSIYLKIDKRNEFPTDVDWELKVKKTKNGLLLKKTKNNYL